MLITKGYHMVHFEAVLMEKKGIKDSGFLGTTHELHAFKNGYGVSVVKGELISYGLYEVAVVRFHDLPKPIRSKRKRHVKKYIKRVAGCPYDLDYNTPVTSDIERFESYNDVRQFFDTVNRLPRK